MGQSTDNKIIDLLTPVDKASLQTGRDCWNTACIDKAGIPSVTVADGPLGLRKDSVNAVAFPSAAKMACGFDVDAMRNYGAALGEQCRANSADVLLGPAVNIKRDPRCGRNFEYFSEDPLLTAALANAYIEGVTSQGTGVCVKHFAANNQEYGRFVCDSVIDDRALREIYLSAFQKIITQSKPCAVMCSYNKLNGEYCSQHKWLLTDVLRGEWGYKGLVMSDWGAVDDRIKGLNAGLDLEMPRGDETAVINALESGELEQSVLDSSVQRVIDFALNFKEMSARTEDTARQRELARKLSAECTVLAKNNCHLLPLDKTDSIAVIGALAQQPVYQGGGSSRVNAISPDSIISALKDSNIEFKYAEGYSLNGIATEEMLDEAREAACGADKVILVVGDKADREERDRSSWQLPANQLAAIDAVTSASSNVVIVLQCGSSVDVSFAYSAKALLIDYYGGECSGQSIVDVIFGDVAPKGRLAETWYLNLPDTANDFDRDFRRALYRESIFVGYRYTSTAEVPVAFPFGYGLSYSKFKWGEVSVSHRDKNKITVSVPITNAGDYTDAEVVQVYATNCDCRDFIERKKLVGFTKVHLKPKEKKIASIIIPVDELSHYDSVSGKFILNGGRYIITVGKDVCDDRFCSEYVVNAENLTADRSGEYACYYNLDEKFYPDDVQFLSLYGKPLAEPAANVNVSTPLADIGKGIVAKILTNKLTRNMDEEDKRYAMAMPLRTFVSQYLSREMMFTIIDMLNGTVLKNMWKLFTQYLACKKARKRARK